MTVEAREFYQGQPLTQRQLQIARLAALGKSNKEIARQLGLVEATIKKTLQVACMKMSCRNRVELTLAVQKLAPA